MIKVIKLEVVICCDQFATKFLEWMGYHHKYNFKVKKIQEKQIEINTS